MARPQTFFEERKNVQIRLNVSLFNQISKYCDTAGLTLSGFFMRQAQVFEKLCEQRPNAFVEIDKIAAKNHIKPEELQFLILLNYFNYRDILK